MIKICPIIPLILFLPVIGILGAALTMIRLAPINILLKLPIMLWSNASEFYPLCSNYAP